MSLVLFIGDVHSPFEDKRAVQLVLNAARYLKPDVLVDLGDLADCYAVSAHDRDPARLRERTFRQEMEHTSAIVTAFDKTKPRRKIKLNGNHEDRFRRFLWQKAPELVGYAPAIAEVLQLKQRGWEVVAYRDYIKLGKLLVTHDIGYAGVYAVRQSLVAAGGSIIFGHTHRMEYRIEGSGTGKRRVGATFGWLGDLSKIDYDHRWKVASSWALGFGYAEIDDRTGLAHATPVPIINYTCRIGKKEIKG